jgi:hypothetical protein
MPPCGPASAEAPHGTCRRPSTPRPEPSPAPHGTGRRSPRRDGARDSTIAPTQSHSREQPGSTPPIPAPPQPTGRNAGRAPSPTARPQQIKLTKTLCVADCIATTLTNKQTVKGQTPRSRPLKKTGPRRLQGRQHSDQRPTDQCKGGSEWFVSGLVLLDQCKEPVINTTGRLGRFSEL